MTRENGWAWKRHAVGAVVRDRESRPGGPLLDETAPRGVYSQYIHNTKQHTK